MLRRCAFFSVLAAVLLLSQAAMAAGAWEIPGAESRFASLEEHRVHYQVMGQGSQTLVLVHGWGCNTGFWHKQAPAFAQKQRVILVDLLGHGKSAKPKLDYTQIRFADSIKAVLEKEGVKRAILIGHSMGTPVCLQTGRLYPELVKAYVVVDGALLFPPKDPKAFADFKKQLAAWLAPMRDKANYLKNVAAFVRPMLGPALPQAVGERIITQMSAMPQYVGASAMQEMFRVDNLDHWKFGPVKKPLLAVYAKSPEITPEFMQNLKEMFPYMQFHLLHGVGHFYMLEKYEEFNRVVLDFVAKLQ